MTSMPFSLHHFFITEVRYSTCGLVVLLSKLRISANASGRSSSAITCWNTPTQAPRLPSQYSGSGSRRSSTSNACEEINDQCVHARTRQKEQSTNLCWVKVCLCGVAFVGNELKQIEGLVGRIHFEVKFPREPWFPVLDVAAGKPTKVTVFVSKGFVLHKQQCILGFLILLCCR